MGAEHAETLEPPKSLDGASRRDTTSGQDPWLEFERAISLLLPDQGAELPPGGKLPIATGIAFEAHDTQAPPNDWQPTPRVVPIQGAPQPPPAAADSPPAARPARGSVVSPDSLAVRQHDHNSLRRMATIGAIASVLVVMLGLYSTRDLELMTRFRAAILDVLPAASR